MSLNLSFKYVNKDLVFDPKKYEEKVRQINALLESEWQNPNNFVGWLHYA